MSHTEGKLKVNGNAIEFEEGGTVCYVANGGYHEDRENARRLAACWNYCILIKTEDIESRIGTLLSRTINPLIKDIDERNAAISGLVKVLEECQLALEPYDDVKPRDWKTDREKLAAAHQAVRAILARYDQKQQPTA